MMDGNSSESKSRNSQERASATPEPRRVQSSLVSFYRSVDTLRSRSVSAVVLTSTVNVPAPPPRLVADWNREVALGLSLEPGDVEPLPLVRTRTRWPDYRHCVQAASDWLGTIGLQGVLASCDVALMACRGARYHHDGEQYGGAAFCNLFLSEDKGLDVHFPATGHRIPLVRGTIFIFDTGQPHAVIQRQNNGFDAADFPPEKDCTQVFLTWELPIEHSALSRALQIDFDTDPSTALQLDNEQIWLNGAPLSVCPNSGQFT